MTVEFRRKPRDRRGSGAPAGVILILGIVFTAGIFAGQHLDQQVIEQNRLTIEGITP